MKKQTLWLIINTLILFIIGFSFLGIYDSIVPKTTYDRLFGETVRFKEDAVVVNEIPTGNQEFDLIHSFQTVYNRKNEKIGYVYHVNSQYNYFEIGKLYLVVGVKLDGTASVQIETLKQTDVYTAGIQQYIFDYFQNFKVSQFDRIPSRDLIQFYDMDAGGTASASTNKVKELVKIVINFYLAGNLEIESDPLIAMFGEGYQLIIDTQFSPTDMILSKKWVKDAKGQDIGTFYHLRGSAAYYDSNEGTINVYVALDMNGIILGVHIPKEEYGHTKSDFFYGKALALANELIGLNISDFNANYDLKSGASNSTNLIQFLIEVLGGELS
jgi:hypothetical protein